MEVKIGWVRGTGLMGGNDPLVDVVERHGILTYSTGASKSYEKRLFQTAPVCVRSPTHGNGAG